MHESIRRIHEAADVLREEHPKCDEICRLTDKTVEVMKESGGFRLTLPRELGGYEERPGVFAEWVRAVARYNPSAGWIAGVVGIHPWQIALFDEKLQREIYGEDPDTLIASPYMPNGTVTPVDGGYRFSTEVGYSTGCDHAEWFILGGKLRNPDGTQPEQPEVVHVVLPKEDVHIVPDSWNVQGLIGTGSKTIRVEDAFIPEYRLMRLPVLLDGGYRDRQPGKALYAMPYLTMFSYAIASGMLGVSHSVIEEYKTYIRARTNPFSTAGRNDPYQAMNLTRAESVWESSVLHVDTIVDRMYEQAAAGKPFTNRDRVVYTAFQTSASQRVADAVDELYRRAGSASRSTALRLERCFRDFMVAASHAAVDAADMYRAYAQVALDPTADPQGRW